jgi:hypothetical protein
MVTVAVPAVPNPVVAGVVPSKIRLWSLTSPLVLIVPVPVIADQAVAVAYKPLVVSVPPVKEADPVLVAA